ncbi:MAG: TolC family protein [Gammaproteobacteria bacterium]|nr:TolC family protein [Gammaproteobacteria bacterium]
MMMFLGRMPNPSTALRKITGLEGKTVALACFFTALLQSPSVLAQDANPLTLREAEELALYDEPGQGSLLSRAEGLREAAVAGGQLPDPTMRVGLANFPIQSGGFSTEGMTQAQLGVRQVFPGGDTRALTTEKLDTLATEMTHKADGRGRDVLTSVRVSWLETHYWRSAHNIALDSRPFFDDLVTITRSLYAVGRKNQQDVLRAELELSRLDDRIIDMNKQHARARAALSEWVGGESSRPVAEKLPEWTAVPPLEVLTRNLESHPAIMAADSSVDARLTGVALARQQYKPDWALDLGYGYRDGSLPNGNPRSDFVSLSVTFDLPFFRRNRQDRTLRAALSEKRAAVQTREEVLRRLNSQLDAEYARWKDLGRRLDLYDRVIISVSADNAIAALAAYQSEAGDFADVMRGYVDDLNTRLDYVRLQVERAQSFAMLANLGGIPR